MSGEQLLYLDGAWVPGDGVQEIRDRWTGDVLGTVAIGGAVHARLAVDAAAGALERPFEVPERSRVLAAVAAAVSARADEFAAAIVAETGKPVTAARGEVGRAVDTLTWAAEETKRITGEVVALDAVEAGAGTVAFTVAQPRGVVAAITPFNFPLNLVLHKVAPALAAGNAVVLKPSDKAVLVAGLLVAAFERAGLPPGRLNLVTGPPAEIVDAWIDDPRVAVLTFTGSSKVGWELKARSPRKQHVLELGSNTAMVVRADADLPRAAADAVTAALSNSGQACVSLQRVYVERAVAPAFVEELAQRLGSVSYGDPRSPETMVGPLITPEATSRLAGVIEAAVDDGARVVVGGTVSDDGVLAPTLLVDVDDKSRVVCEEAFGPVVSVIEVDSLEDALARVNASDYGLNTSVYTSDLASALTYARSAEAGSVLVNMPPSFRADHMPYGGVKDSGQGTEGVRYAIEELLHHKLVVLKP
ncbi:aldehyde dehydrogenase family protein [Jiangella rhizosphaerae]|uniref:aldehyde dehydrogenase family protein n=1 Tax=Jiangella rhizosphaerae TaxID=2293569 RepID=UPI001314972A|nr:aldehyde dehydrogenase family protein [Jiangella rhizosphaerae]